MFLLWLLFVSIPSIVKYTEAYSYNCFRSFAREDAPVLLLFGVLPSFCSSSTAGRVSISWRSHVGAWPGEVLNEQPKIKNLPLEVGSAASLWKCQLNPRSFLSLPRVAPARLSMQGFNNLLHARRGAEELTMLCSVILGHGKETKEQNGWRVPVQCVASLAHRPQRPHCRGIPCRCRPRGSGRD